MLGDEAYRLAKEAKNVTPDHIPSYNKELVQIVTQEARYLWTRIEEMIAQLNSASQQATELSQEQPLYSQTTLDAIQPVNSQPTVREQTENTNAQTALYFLTLNRNKRCLLAYHYKRMEFIRSLLWNMHLAPPLVSTKLSEKLSPEEQNYAKEYAKLNTIYRDTVEGQLCPMESLGWTADGELPPRDLFVEVRVIKDCGDIVTENGVVSLQAGSQHYLHRSDVEHLITIGYLEHISPV